MAILFKSPLSPRDFMESRSLRSMLTIAFSIGMTLASLAICVKHSIDRSVWSVCSRRTVTWTRLFESLALSFIELELWLFRYQNQIDPQVHSAAPFHQRSTSFFPLNIPPIRPVRRKEIAPIISSDGKSLIVAKFIWLFVSPKNLGI